MALVRNVPASFTVQLPDAVAPVTAKVGGVALATQPAKVAGTLDSYTITLTAAETDAETRYLLCTDAGAQEYGFTLVTGGGALTTVQDAHLMAIPTTGGATVDPALVAASLIPLLEASPKLSHTPTGWVLVTHATVGQSRCTDQSANPLGGVVITAYLETDIERYNPLNDSASSNVVGHVGEWGILVPPGGIRDLVFVSPNQTSVTTKVTV